jgi:hypothetical protein
VHKFGPAQSLCSGERICAPHAATVEAHGCSPDEADDPAFDYCELALAYVPHMQTHASDLVRNLTRAISIAPALAPEAAEEYLAAARRQLG